MDNAAAGDDGGMLYIVLVVLTGVVIHHGAVTWDNAGNFAFECGSILAAAVLAARSEYRDRAFDGSTVARRCRRAFENRSRILGNCLMLLLLGLQWHSWSGAGGGTKGKGFYGYSLPALTIVGVMILCANAEHICSFIETTLRAVDPPERRWRPRADTLLTAGAVALNVAAVIVSAGTAGVVVGAIAALCGGARDAMGHDGTHARRLRAAVNATQKRLVRLAFSPLLLPACLVVVTLTICQWPARTSAGMLHLMTAFKVALCLVHVWYAPPAADPRAPAPPANPANPVNAFSWFQTTLTVGGWLAFLWTEFKLADRRAYTMGGVTTAAIATALAVTTPGQARRLRGVLFVFTLGVVVCMLFVPFEYANNAIKAWSFVKGLFGGQGWSFFFNGDLFQAIGDFFKSAAKTC